MARPVVIIAVEGVLMKNIDQPSMEGIALYRAFSATHNIILICDYHDEKFMKDWFMLEDLQSHGKVHYINAPNRNCSTEHLDFAMKIKRQGSPIHYVIESDPQKAALLLKNGFNTLLCSHYSYAYPQWMPDYPNEIRPWDELTRTIDEQVKLKASDKRISGGNEVVPDVF